MEQIYPDHFYKKGHFLWAIEQMQQGKKIIKPNWRNTKCHLFMIKNNILVCDYNDKIAVIETPEDQYNNRSRSYIFRRPFQRRDLLFKKYLMIDNWEILK